VKKAKNAPAEAGDVWTAEGVEFAGVVFPNRRPAGVTLRADVTDINPASETKAGATAMKIT
jgi:hypothetical protein